MEKVDLITHEFQRKLLAVCLLFLFSWHVEIWDAVVVSEVVWLEWGLWEVGVEAFAEFGEEGSLGVSAVKNGGKGEENESDIIAAIIWRKTVIDINWRNQDRWNRKAPKAEQETSFWVKN